jgi:hypothetical protein
MTSTMSTARATTSTARRIRTYGPAMKIAAGVLLAAVAIALRTPLLYAAVGSGPTCGAAAGPERVGSEPVGSERVGPPSSELAWRARVLSTSPIHPRPPAWIPVANRSVQNRRTRNRSVRDRSVLTSRPETGRLPLLTPADASWVLVLGARRDAAGRCWLRIRLPWRPNDATGWIQARHVLLRATRWRIVVSLAARAVTLYRGGMPVYRARVVIGARATPTPRGLFAIVSVWRSPPMSFLGSYILLLSAHSEALPHFDGGDGQVALHGRGGASLLDPLGSASSHGCVRLANRAIDAIVRLVGRAGLPGIPVHVD